jgi:hypothetical protein
MANDARCARQAAEAVRTGQPTTGEELKSLLKDTLSTAKCGYRFAGPNFLAPLLIGGAFTGGTLPLNQKVGNATAADPWSPAIVKPVEYSAFGVAPAVATAFAVFGHSAEARRIAAESIAGNGYLVPLVDVPKLLIKSKRPDGSGFDGFPSGHAAQFFMLARIAGKDHPLWVRVVLHVAAVAATSTRVGGAKHYLFQVGIGGTIGEFTGGMMNDAYDATRPEPTHGLSKLISGENKDGTVSWQLEASSGYVGYRVNLGHNN